MCLCDWDSRTSRVMGDTSKCSQNKTKCMMIQDSIVGNKQQKRSGSYQRIVPVLYLKAKQLCAALYKECVLFWTGKNKMWHINIADVVKTSSELARQRICWKDAGEMCVTSRTQDASCTHRASLAHLAPRFVCVCMSPCMLNMCGRGKKVILHLT